MTEVVSQPLSREVNEVLATSMQTVEIPADYSGDFILPPTPPVAPMTKLQMRLCEDGGFTMYGRGMQPSCVGLESPLDEETGLPLPLILTDRFSSNHYSQVDFHHLFHPHNLMNKDPALHAVRTSYGQDLPRGLHERYHEYFGGPSLTMTRGQAFRVTVLACAGVVPRQAIDLRRSPVTRETTDDEYATIVATTHREGTHRRDGGQTARSRIAAFFSSYALEQSIHDLVSDTVIDEFLYTADRTARWKLGNQILSAQVDVSVDPVRPLYRNLREEGLVQGRSVQPEKVVKRFFTAGHLSTYHVSLGARLAE